MFNRAASAVALVALACLTGVSSAGAVREGGAGSVALDRGVAGSAVRGSDLARSAARDRGIPGSAAARAPKGRLKAFRSCKPLIRYARRNARRGRGAVPPRFAPPPAPIAVPGPPAAGGAPEGSAPQPVAAPAPAPDARTTDPGTSPTNVQEEGVDEPDIVKTRGSTAFVVAGGRLHAIDVRGAPRLLGSLPLTGFDHELLLSGKRLLVISDDYATDGGSQGAPFYGRPVAILTEVDVSEPGAMGVVRTQRIGGSHVTARLNGDTARVIVSSQARGLAEEDLRPRLAGWVPRSTVRSARTGRHSTRRLTACRNVRRSTAYSGVDMLTVLTIDMSKGLPAVDSDAVMTGADIAYASSTSLYVATQRWAPEPDSPTDPPPPVGTAIHKFDISEPSKTTYRATGRVRGYLLNQFSLSERRGVLRAASTETPTWWGGAPASESESFVTTLDERPGRLAELGRVDGLGRGERIYAVRFIDDVGFVVTFRQTDPLYTIDLADPARPRVLGELKIRGYSAYLHPVGKDLIVGVGQDATEQGFRLGTQLSLFDVSNLSAPTRLHQHSVGRGSSSQVEYDHHAFLWWAPANTAVLPVQEYAQSGPFVGAIGFHVSRAAGIGEVGRASHQGDRFSPPILRSFVVGGRLFTLSDLGLEANDLGTLAEQGSLRFPPGPAPSPGPTPVPR